MADKVDGSIVVAHLQVAFLWECDNYRLSPCGRPFPCLPNLVAGRALGSLIHKYRAADGLPFSVYEKLYHSCVVSIVDYCAGVWGSESYLKCNTIHNRAIRAYLGVHNKSSNLAINGDVGWLEPDIRGKLEMTRMWDRLVNMDDNRLTKRVFLWDYNQPHG